MSDGHVRKLSDKGESNRTKDRLLKTRTDDGVAVPPQQHRRAVFQDVRKRFTAFDRADETRSGIDGWAFGWKKSRIYMGGTKAAFLIC